MVAWGVGAGVLSTPGDNQVLPKYMLGEATDVKALEAAKKAAENSGGALSLEEAERIKQLHLRDSLQTKYAERFTGILFNIKKGENLHLVPYPDASAIGLNLEKGMMIKEVVYSSDANLNTRIQFLDGNGQKLASVTLQGLRNPADIGIYAYRRTAEGDEEQMLFSGKITLRGIMKGYDVGCTASQTSRLADALIRKEKKDSTLNLITESDMRWITEWPYLNRHVDYEFSEKAKNLKTEDTLSLPHCGLQIKREAMLNKNGLKPQYSHLSVSQTYDILGGKGAYSYTIMDRERLQLLAYAKGCPDPIKKILKREGLALPKEAAEALDKEWMPPQYPELHPSQVIANATGGGDRLTQGSYQAMPEGYTLNIIHFKSSDRTDRVYDDIMEWFDPQTRHRINVIPIQDFLIPHTRASWSNERYDQSWDAAGAAWQQHIIDTRAAIEGPVILAFTSHAQKDGWEFAKAGAPSDWLFELLTIGARKAEAKATGKPIEECQGFRTDVLDMTCYNAHHANAFEQKGVPGSVFIAMNESNEIFIPTRAVKTRAAIKSYLNSSLCYQRGISAYDFMITSILKGGTGESTYDKATNLEFGWDFGVAALKDGVRGISEAVNPTMEPKFTYKDTVLTPGGYKVRWKDTTYVKRPMKDFAVDRVHKKELEKKPPGMHRGIPQMVIAGGDKAILNVQYLANTRFQRFSREGGALFSPEEVMRLKANPVIQYFVPDIDIAVGKLEREMCQYNKFGDMPRESESLSLLLAFSVVALPPFNGVDNPVVSKIRATIFSDKKVDFQERKTLQEVDNLLKTGLITPAATRRLKAIHQKIVNQSEMQR